MAFDFCEQSGCTGDARPYRKPGGPIEDLCDRHAKARGFTPGEPLRDRAAPPSVFDIGVGERMPNGFRPSNRARRCEVRRGDAVMTLPQRAGGGDGVGRVRLGVVSRDATAPGSQGGFCADGKAAACGFCGV
jgi:hypothetical protein